jgi:hypothetical protein
MYQKFPFQDLTKYTKNLYENIPSGKPVSNDHFGTGLRHGQF